MPYHKKMSCSVWSFYQLEVGCFFSQVIRFTLTFQKHASLGQVLSLNPPQVWIRVWMDYRVCFSVSKQHEQPSCFCQVDFCIKYDSNASVPAQFHTLSYAFLVFKYSAIVSEILLEFCFPIYKHRDSFFILEHIALILPEFQIYSCRHKCRDFLPEPLIGSRSPSVFEGLSLKLQECYVIMKLHYEKSNVFFKKIMRSLRVAFGNTEHHLQTTVFPYRGKQICNISLSCCNLYWNIKTCQVISTIIGAKKRWQSFSVSFK